MPSAIGNVELSGQRNRYASAVLQAVLKAVRSVDWQFGAAELLFAVILARCLFDGASLLNDPGTPWQVGQDVWVSGPPQFDRYSYTRAGERWISQHWLFDAGLARLFELGSWPLLIVFSAMLIALTYMLLYKVTVSLGANAYCAALLTLVAAGAGAPSWLCRPHLVTFLGVVITVWLCFDYADRGGRRIWYMPLIMVAWCNMHGGFLAGLVILSVSAFGLFLESLTGLRRWHMVAELGLVTAGSFLATLLNPYGLELCRHLLDIIFFSEVRPYIDEWRPLQFGTGTALAFELLLLLAIVFAACRRRRIRWMELLQVAVWAHFGLCSARNSCLAALVLVPVLGRWARGLISLRQLAVLSCELPGTSLRRLAARGRLWSRFERRRGKGAWIVLTSALSLLFCLAGLRPFAARDLEARAYPLFAVDRLVGNRAEGRLFHRLEWGGYLILRGLPRKGVFIDDRFELYGKRFLLDYIRALQGAQSWQKLDAEFHFDYVLVKPDDALAFALERSGQWRVIWQDSKAVLLERSERDGTVQGRAARCTS